MKLSTVALSTALAATAALSPQANAGTSAANGTAFCQSALPVFDTQIRKRPLGINNEGNSSAFISCSIPIGYNPDNINNGVIYMTNRNVVAVDVTCTMVDGVAADLGAGTPVYYPETVNVPAGLAGVIVWDPEDFGLTTFSPYQNYSCSLPAGVEVNLLGFDYDDTPPAP